VSDRAVRSRSFETVAAEYERHRPAYPEEALRWAAEQVGVESGTRVLDVGAGTGKLTRGLVSLGFEVVAVEPGAPMLAQLRTAVPEAEAFEAPAESIPLPDESVDAAFAGQAYHWFDRERAVPELHRELGVLVGYAGHEPYRNEELPAAPWFREVARTIVESQRQSTPDWLVAYLGTSSMFLTMDVDERDRRLAEVQAIASRCGERFQLPLLTYVFAFERLS
jgi:SAM-dependent methyltransferase